MMMMTSERFLGVKTNFKRRMFVLLCICVLNERVVRPPYFVNTERAQRL